MKAETDSIKCHSPGALALSSIKTDSSSKSLKDRIFRLLDEAGLGEALKKNDRTILIKPNLVEALPPPITTPPDIVGCLIDYIKAFTSSELVIGEGTGSLDYDTWHPFRELGYVALAEEKGARLADLNTEECIELRDRRCRRWPVMFLPRIAMESFLISVPVLKAHTLADVTLTLKNMMGLAPPDHFQQGGAWKKSAFHSGIHEAIADLNRYRNADFTLLDAREGMAEAHLFGPKCSPPPGIVAASFDPVAVDAYGTSILGMRWKDIGHISLLHGELGMAEPLKITKL